MHDSSTSNMAMTPLVEKTSKSSNTHRPIPVRRSTSKLNFKDLLQALRRKWLPALILGVILATIAGIALWFVIPLAKPTAYARLRILEKMAGGTWVEHPDPPLQRQTQIALIKDPLTLSTVLRRPEVAQLAVIREQADPEDWLLKELKVEFPFGPELMQISMTGERAQDLKTIVNAVREVYLRQFVDDTRRDRQERLKRLQEYDAKTKADLELLREKLKRNAEQGKEIDKETIALKQKLSMELLEYTKKQIIQYEANLRQLRTELKIASEESVQSINSSNRIFDDLVDQHPQLEPFKRKKMEIQDLIDKTKQVAPSNPKIAQYQKDLEENQKQMDQKKVELRPQVLADMKFKFQSSKEAFLETMKFKIKEDEEHIKTLREHANSLVKDSTDLSSNTVKVQEDQMQIALWESIRSRLAGTIEGFKMEAEAPGRIQSFGDANVTSLDKYSNKIRFSALGSAVAFLLGLLVVAFLESRARRIDSPEDVLDHFGMTVVGKVPAPPKRLRLGFSGADREEEDTAWQAVLTESVDSFRTQLLHTARKNDQQIMMVCSADSGEGKTSLACHLALSLARSGQKTLLIDADLRNPTAHELFEMKLEPGLSEVIRDQTPSAEAVQRTSAPGLWLLPAGSCNTRVIELLAQDALKPIFADLKQEFDFIVVDTSPILPVADPLLIAQHADCVIFSLMHQVSRVSATRDALEKLNALNIHTLGAVMNGTKAYRGYNQRKYAYRTLNT